VNQRRSPLICHPHSLVHKPRCAQHGHVRSGARRARSAARVLLQRCGALRTNCPGASTLV